jgi:two-component system phosphate regulon sensor histidine kinase PhoR
MLLIALAALAVVVRNATSSLRRFYLDRTAADLESRARLAEGQMTALLADKNYARIDALCKELGRRSATRLTVILPDGRVVGDSDELPQQMDNHGRRPEVLDALDGGRGVSLRYSQTLQETLRYVAVAARSQGRTLGVVRTAVSLAAIDGALAGISTHILLAGAIVAALLAAVSLIVARRAVKPLEQLNQHAEWFARGDLGHRLPAAGTQEVDGLAGTLNKLAADLSEKLAVVVRQRNERDAILSSMVEGVLAIDADEHVLSINAAAARLLGTDAPRAAGRLLAEIVRNSDLDGLVARVLATRQPAEAEIALRDREPRFLHVHGTVFGDDPDSRPGAVLVFHDITELKRLEGVRREFVANVSHELKTPVTSIQGYVETLLDGAMNNSDDRERFLRIVAKHTERLHAILDDLLTLAQVEQERGKRQDLLTRGPIRPVLEAAVADCSASAAEKRMRLTVGGSAELAAPINASLLQQAVVNLLKNAIAYSPAGESVDVDCVDGPQDIEVRVRDRGCGIAPEHLPRIFARFYRVDKSRSRESGGTGLGLAIVKHIAQLHGGRAAVESTPGSGSTFSLFLPKQ